MLLNIRRNIVRSGCAHCADFIFDTIRAVILRTIFPVFLRRTSYNIGKRHLFLGCLYLCQIALHASLHIQLFKGLIDIHRFYSQNGIFSIHRDPHCPVYNWKIAAEYRKFIPYFYRYRQIFYGNLIGGAHHSFCSFWNNDHITFQLIRAVIARIDLGHFQLFLSIRQHRRFFFFRYSLLRKNISIRQLEPAPVNRYLNIICISNIGCFVECIAFIRQLEFQTCIQAVCCELPRCSIIRTQLISRFHIDQAELCRKHHILIIGI